MDKTKVSFKQGLLLHSPSSYHSGLKTFGIDLKVASKFFGTKFACGASITGDDEIVIQGDCKDELFDIIPEKWPDVSQPSSFYLHWLPCYGLPVQPRLEM